MSTLSVFVTSYLIITLSPGPNVLLVLKNAAQHGMKAAAISVLANLTCQLGIVCLVGLGAGTLLVKLPLMFLILKILGGSYLIYLGVKMLRNSQKSTIRVPHAKSDLKTVTFWRLFNEGFIVSISNPKTLLFLAAFLPQFLVTGNPVIPQFAIMYLSIALCVTLVHFFYAYCLINIKLNLMAKSGVSDFIPTLKNTIQRLTGGLFIFLGGGILFSQK